MNTTNGNTMIGSPRIGAVVLTHNSTAELPLCLEGLAAQTGVDLHVVVVDNNSIPEERSAMETEFLKCFANGVVTNASKPVSTATALFLRNSNNNGYSGGNNIGAKVAIKMGCTAVLIVNPDVRIYNPNYIATLATLISADPHTAVACSAMENLSGEQENPMHEPSFIEELSLPLHLLTMGFFRTKDCNLMYAPDTRKVEKVTGSCFMIRSDFLEKIGFFDEGVFLYCEEAILMMQVRRAGWHMMMETRISALHAHRRQAKGDPRPRFSALVKSRAYFYRTYSDYGVVKRVSLLAALKARLMVVHLRHLFQRWKR